MKTPLLAAALATTLILGAGEANAACSVSAKTVTTCTLSEFVSTWLPANLASVSTGISKYTGYLTATVTPKFDWYAGLSTKTVAGKTTYTAVGVSKTGQIVKQSFVVVPFENAASGLPALGAMAAAGLWLARRRTQAA